MNVGRSVVTHQNMRHSLVYTNGKLEHNEFSFSQCGALDVIMQQGFLKCDVIDLFSLYVLFSHFRPRDATRGNSFFQVSSYARANVRITNEKNKRKIPMRASRGLKWENKMYKLKRSINK